MSLIEAFVDRCTAHSPRIGVIGDSMIDSYYQVSVKRISPEFPIPVMLTDTDLPSKSVPGGAANVARQLLDLNCKSRLVCISDQRLRKILRDHEMEFGHTFYCDHAVIPEKKRFYDQDFPICRLDVEKENYGIRNNDVVSNFREMYDDVVSNFREMSLRFYSKEDKKDDILILSDYGKGFFHNAHSWCDLGITTIVDPKDGPLWKWVGCDIFKPNANDAEKLSGGKTDKKRQCVSLYTSLNCKHIVVTESGNGVYGLEDGEFFEIKNENKIIPRSVIGAGDCFSAFLALAIAHNFSIRDASEIAFKAGQCYVQNIHNEPVTLYDLLKSENPIAAKYRLPKRKGSDRLVFVNGCFDILHSGHLAFLRFAKSKGDRLVVALNSDESVKRLKGDSRPIRTLRDRMEAVACLEFVDHVVGFDEDTPMGCIEKINPNIIVIGGEYQNNLVDMAAIKIGFKMEYFPRIKGISTSEEIKRIRS